MVERRLFANTGEGFQGALRTLLHQLCCFIVIYLLLLIFLLPIILMMCYRLLLTLIFATYYKGKYRLLECKNACFGLDRYANVLSLYVFMYINGPCDINFLRQRINHIFTTFKDKNGGRPYEVMLCGLVKKSGFFCWENLRDSFDIRHHIRFLPGCCDPNRIYTEAEVFDASAKLVDDLWDESRPKWEFLVVPHLRKDDTGEVCSAIHLRMQHAYVDGISTAQLIRLCLADKPPAKFIYDPVKPPIHPRPIWTLLLAYLQVIILGPWACLKFLSNKEEHIFYEGPLSGGKYFGRSKFDFSLMKLREIREVYGCTTSSIMHYAMAGALRKVALKKGYPIPDTILGSLILAMMPYPNEYPQNQAILIAANFPIGIQQRRERLAEIDRVCRSTTHPFNYYVVLTTKLFFRIVGLFPVSVIEKSVSSFKLSYCMSNVPGTSETISVNGYNVVTLFGVGPLMNGFRYFTGVGCYENKFTFGFHCEKSSLIKSREDLNEFIAEFENKIQMLFDEVGFNEC